MILLNALLLAFTTISAASAEDKFAIEGSLREAISSTFENAPSGETSEPVRLFLAILKRDPENTRAKFELLLIDRWTHRTAGPDRQINAFIERESDLKAVIESESKKGNTALLHFMKAIYANFLHDFSVAKSEIELAINLEPDNAEYWFWKSRIYSDAGSWLKDDELSNLSIEFIKKAKKAADISKTNSLPSYAYYWQAAVTFERFTKPKLRESIDSYLKAASMVKDKNSSRLAFAYSNVADNFLQMDDCQRAKEYALLSLQVRTFGDADRIRATAVACMEFLGGEKVVATSK